MGIDWLFVACVLVGIGLGVAFGFLYETRRG